MPKNNVNPDHYKVKGHERPGDDVVHRAEKREMSAAQSRFTRRPTNPTNPESPIPKPGRKA